MGLLTTPVSGMDAYSQMMQTVGNNIANVNTVGFKGSDINFENMLSQTLSQGASSGGGTNPEQIGLGVQVGQIRPDFSEGSLVKTGVPSDLAINGQGFFVVNTKPDGTGTEYYERAGNFTPNSAGYLVDPNGNYLMSAGTTAPASNPLPAGSAASPTMNTAVNILTTPTSGTGVPSTYTIGNDGTVTVDNGNTYYMALADFPNPDGLVNLGNNLYTAPAGGNQGAVSYAQGGQAGAGTIIQGTLEQSNVDLTKEMSNMIEAQTDYNANSKVINSANQMLEFMLQNV